MYAYNVTERDLNRAAETAGVRVTKCEHDASRDRLIFRLGRNLNTPERFRSLSPQFVIHDTPESVLQTTHHTHHGGTKWRRTANLCYHGVWWFLLYLYEQAPEAVIETNWYGHIKYTKDTWMEVAAELGKRPLGPVGNIYHHLSVKDKCNCERVKIPQTIAIYDAGRV